MQDWPSSIIYAIVTRDNNFHDWTSYAQNEDNKIADWWTPDHVIFVVIIIIIMDPFVIESEMFLRQEKLANVDHNAEVTIYVPENEPLMILWLLQ